jgi:hypothetical protein
MRRSVIAFVFLAGVAALLSWSGAYAQTVAAPAPAQGKAKVIFYYGRPFCIDQVGILIDGTLAHQLGKLHVWQTDLTPSPHFFSGERHPEKVETATLVAGQTYYYDVFVLKGTGFSLCGNIQVKFTQMKPKEIQKAAQLVGKPGVDETPVVPAVAAEAPKPATVKLAIVSTPEAADIQVDGTFMGNTPSAIELPLGDHDVVVSKRGYEAWERKIRLASGDIKLNAELEKRAAPQ